MGGIWRGRGHLGGRRRFPRWFEGSRSVREISVELGGIAAGGGVQFG